MQEVSQCLRENVWPGLFFSQGEIKQNYSFSGFNTGAFALPGIDEWLCEGRDISSALWFSVPAWPPRWHLNAH